MIYRGLLLLKYQRRLIEDKILLMANQKNYELDEIGIMAPEQQQVDELPREVGYLAASIKSVADTK